MKDVLVKEEVLPIFGTHQINYLLYLILTILLLLFCLQLICFLMKLRENDVKIIFLYFQIVTNGVTVSHKQQKPIFSMIETLMMIRKERERVVYYPVHLIHMNPTWTSNNFDHEGDNMLE